MLQTTGLLLLVTTVLKVAAEWSHNDLLAAIAAAVAVACLILLTPQVGWGRRLFVAIALALTAWAYAVLPEWSAAVGRALGNMAFIAAFFIALATLRNAAAGSAAIVRCGLYLANQPPGRRYLALTFGGHLFALVLNYGSISLFGSLIERSLQAETDPVIRRIRTRRMLLAIQRGFVTTLTWWPLTFAMVMSLAVVPGSRWETALPYCLIAALLLGVSGWVLDTLFKPRNVTPPPRQPNPSGAWKTLLPLLGLLLLLIGLVAGLQLATGLRTVTVVMLVVPLISLAWIALQKKPPFPQAEFTASLGGRVQNFTRRELPAYAPELVLLMCAGYIGILAASLLTPLVHEGLLGGGHLSPLVLIGVLWFVPLAGQLGMNPILSVTLVGPLLPHAEQMGVTPEMVVLALVSGWALTGASSPFTATNMLVGKFGGVSPLRAGLGWNGAYTLVSGLALSAWLAYLVS